MKSKSSSKLQSNTRVGKTSLSKYLINLDWLEIMCFGIIEVIDKSIFSFSNSTIKISDRIFLAPNIENKHPGFLFCFDIYYNNIQVAYLFHKESGKYRFKRKNSVQLRLANKVLYNRDFAQILDEIIKELGINFSHYYRLDIAIDGAAILKKANRFIKNKNFVQIRRTKIKTQVDNINKSFTSILLGNKTSDKMISIYNKSEQMLQEQKQEPGYKKYIIDYWKNNRLNKSGAIIDRIELRLFGKNLNTISHNFNDLTNPEYIASIFKKNTFNILTFCNVKNHKIRETLIDFGMFKTQEPNNNLQVITKPNNINSIKRALKILIFESYSNHHPNLDNAISIICNEFGLYDWLRRQIETKWKYKLSDTIKKSIRFDKALLKIR